MISIIIPCKTKNDLCSELLPALKNQSFNNFEILIKPGEEVKKNQVIAKVGKTGRASEPYLHFQVRKGHEPQDPFNYLP